MPNPAFLVAAGLLALAAPVAAPALPAPAASPAGMPQEIPALLDWTIGPRDTAEPAQPGMVEFQLGYRTEHHSSSWGREVALASLTGLTEAQLNAEGQPVTFVMHRDAGDFHCKGVAGQGRGTGTCVYAASPGFPAALARRGVSGGLDALQQFQLSLSDIGFAYLDELKREAYATPTADDLVRAGTHGAGLRQLLAMNGAGYRFGDVASFVRARDHGVSARYVEALKAAGYTRLTAADLVRLRDHGVSANFITELKDAGYVGLTPDDLTRLRDHGISTGFIRTANQGGTRLAPEDLIRLREGGARRLDRPDRPDRPGTP